MEYCKKTWLRWKSKKKKQIEKNRLKQIKQINTMRLPDLNITDHQREKNILDNIRVDHQDLTQLKWQDWVKLF